ncbi:MAG: bifunctional phosphopantothenoylcysteine decarboxylase/phosphopantothenate--cysteine ligase CoaBC [Chloroflexi bacterium]|nr:bifunctional phosphopantothenoylcysteine decarboxylase/phosphopantothenate--cysteine ligase CoaBC [Chloroflexota bacterium]
MTENPLKNKHILLAVSGSIAAYKAVELASQLTKAGALVDVILTQAAEKLVSALTFRSVTGRKAFTDSDLWGNEEHVVHITLARRADIMMVAPASANSMAKLAHGIGDNLLSVTALAATCPLVVAPAMDAGMFNHPATQANLKILQERGATIVGPAEGHLASGLKGKGRMLEAAELYAHLRYILSRSNELAGKKFLISAGGTQEALDPVRFLGNHSSGKQGFALAQAALDAGAEVTLISAPTSLTPPVGANLIPVVSAEDMLMQVTNHVDQADVVIMAAAVADFRPATSSAQKIKKESKLKELDLEPTTDILKALGEYKKSKKPSLLLVGFAAESEHLLENASKKLEGKNLNLIIANDISRSDAGFAVDTNEVTMLFRDGKQLKIPKQNKEVISQKIIDTIINLLRD